MALEASRSANVHREWMAGQRRDDVCRAAIALRSDHVADPSQARICRRHREQPTACLRYHQPFTTYEQALIARRITGKPADGLR